MPWRTTFHNTVTTPLPADVHPGAIVALLHNHSYLIHTQPIVTRFSPQPPPPTSDDQGITYDVWERIGILPFGIWTREIHFTAGFRDTQAGVDSRVDAPMGFVSDATYVVRRREAGDEVNIKSESDHNGDDETAMKETAMGEGEWVLEEKIRSECAAILKPFIQGTMIPVRRKMHEGMIAHVRSQQLQQEAVAWSRGESDGGEVARPAAVAPMAS